MAKNQNIHSPAGKRQFIKTFLNSVRDDMLALVDKMPEEWDGHELKELAHLEFARERTEALLDKRSARYKAFASAVFNDLGR